MSCTSPNAYRVDLVCDDTDLTEVLTGYVMDDYGNICGAVCAIVDNEDGNKVKVSFSNYLCQTTTWYYVCRDTGTTPDEFYVCMPGTANDPDCCPDCPGCMSDTEQLARTVTASITITATKPNAYEFLEDNGPYELSWNNSEDCWEYISDGTDYNSYWDDYDTYLIRVYTCSSTTDPYGQLDGDAQVVMIQCYLGVYTILVDYITNAGCSKGPYTLSATSTELTDLDITWEFSD